MALFLILKLCIGCDARLEAIQKLKKATLPLVTAN